MHVATKNKRGFMHPLSKLSKEFVAYAQLIPDKVLDLGCAYGVATLYALNQGVNHIIACDIEQKHLDILSAKVKEIGKLDSITLNCGAFPAEINFAEHSLGAVLAAYVLPYLSKDELISGLSKIYTWLQPGGKLFICGYSIYIKEFMNDTFKDYYNQRLLAGDDFPGYFDNYNSLSSMSQANLEADILPQNVHFFDIEPLTKQLIKNGLKLNEPNI